MGRPPLRFLTRARCHLCDDALEVLSGAGIDVEVVDIDRDDALLAVFDLRVPVVLGPNGEVVAEGIITDEDARRLRR